MFQTWSKRGASLQVFPEEIEVKIKDKKEFNKKEMEHNKEDPNLCSKEKLETLKIYQARSKDYADWKVFSLYQISDMKKMHLQYYPVERYENYYAMKISQNQIVEI